MSTWYVCDHCHQDMTGQDTVVRFLLDGKEIHVRINPSDPNMGVDHKDFCPDCLWRAVQNARPMTYDQVRKALEP
jgi:hypothetical protein